MTIETRRQRLGRVDFVILVSGFFRHSDFVIRASWSGLCHWSFSIAGAASYGPNESL
jgi:hypothetical protein